WRSIRSPTYRASPRAASASSIRRSRTCPPTCCWSPTSTAITTGSIVSTTSSKSSRLRLSSVSEQSILDHIDALVDEEHRLRSESEQGRLDDEGHRRLEAIQGELDSCWQRLRRRRANPDAPDNIDPVPDPPNDL